MLIVTIPNVRIIVESVVVFDSTEVAEIVIVIVSIIVVATVVMDTATTTTATTTTTTTTKVTTIIMIIISAIHSSFGSVIGISDMGRMIDVAIGSITVIIIAGIVVAEIGIIVVFGDTSII